MRLFTEPELQHLEQLLGTEDFAGDVRRVFLSERANTFALFDWLQKTRRWNQATGTTGDGSVREKAYRIAFHLIPASVSALALSRSGPRQTGPEPRIEKSETVLAPG
jgi:hypothetical protein